MPFLGTFAILRFDIVPTVIGIAALVVIHRRPAWFGALAGLGASIKVWPIVLLFGEWDRRRLLVSALAAAMTISLVLLAAAIAFGDLSTFLDEQGNRGLQEEAVAAAPWDLRELVTTEPAPRVLRFGAWEIASPTGDAVADVLKWLSVAALAAAALWWWFRARAIHDGRTDLADAAVSRDFIFTIVLLLVVTSRVLSPQFMLWLVGLAAVVLTAGTTRLARPAWIVLGASLLTTTTLGLGRTHPAPQPGAAGGDDRRLGRDGLDAAPPDRLRPRTRPSEAESPHPGLIPAEVMRQLVTEGDLDLLRQQFAVVAEVPFQGVAVDHDPVLVAFAGKPVAVVLAVGAFLGPEVRDDDRDARQHLLELVGEAVDRVGDERFERIELGLTGHAVNSPSGCSRAARRRWR